MAEDSTELPPLESFIAAFNRYEVEAGAFALKDSQGYPWWDLVRYRVRFALCVEREIYGRTEALPRAKLVRAWSFAQQALRLLRDFARLHGRGAGRARALIISRRAIDYLTDVAAAEAEHGHGMLFVSRSLST